MAAKMTWPSSVMVARQQNELANQPPNEPRTPTWPASLPRPGHSAPTQPHPNLYLLLSQVLEWEIWNHNQTRAGFCTEVARRSDLEAEVWKLSQVIGQWQATHRAACNALEEHTIENERLRFELEEMADRLRLVEGHQQPFPVPELSARPPSGMVLNDAIKLPGRPEWSKASEAEDVTPWRRGYVRPIDEQSNGRESV